MNMQTTSYTFICMMWDGHVKVLTNFDDCVIPAAAFLAEPWCCQELSLWWVQGNKDLGTDSKRRKSKCKHSKFQDRRPGHSISAVGRLGLLERSSLSPKIGECCGWRLHVLYVQWAGKGLVPMGNRTGGWTAHVSRVWMSSVSWFSFFLLSSILLLFVLCSQVD